MISYEIQLSGFSFKKLRRCDNSRPRCLGTAAGTDRQVPLVTGPVCQFTAAPPQPTHPPVPLACLRWTFELGGPVGPSLRTFAFLEPMAQQGKEKMVAGRGGNL